MVTAIKKFFDRLANALKQLAVNPVELLCKLIGVFGIFAVTLEISFMVASWLQADVGGELTAILPKPLLIGVMLAGYLGGFLLQGLVLLALNRKREHDYSWEGTVKYFNRTLAIPAFIVMLLFSVLVRQGIYGYFIGLYHNGILKAFDDYSIQPYLLTAAFILTSAVGIWVQFFPYDRIITFSRMLWLMALSLLCMLASNDRAGVGVCFAIFVGCSVLSLNQSYITRAYRTVTVTKLNDKARLYNMRMVLLALTLTSIAGIFVFILITGVWYILRFLLLLAVMTLLRGGGTSLVGSRPEQAGDAVFDSTFREDTVSGPFSVILTVIIIVLAIVYLISMRTRFMSAVVAAIKQWFDDFIAFFMGSDKYEPEVELNYKDEVETVKAQRPTRARRTLARRSITYREFESELASLGTDEEKLSYSYAVMVELLSRLNPALRPADTPRELKDKITATMAMDSISDITSAIELIKYAERAADSEICRSALSEVCLVISRRLD